MERGPDLWIIGRIGGIGVSKWGKDLNNDWQNSGLDRFLIIVVLGARGSNPCRGGL